MVLKSWLSSGHNNFQKFFTFVFFFSIICSSLHVFHSSGYALDEGGATAGFEYRSVNREAFIDTPSQHEINYHMDMWQNVPNVGRVELWADWINAKTDDQIDKLGRAYIALRGLRLNDFVLTGLAGDSTVLFTNLPEKFSNSAYPDIYFRGGQAELLAKWGKAQVFGGNVARLKGLLGRTYDSLDESFYGFRGNFRPIPSLLIGTGFIRTQGEVDNNNKPVTKNNNIFLFDSEMEVFNWMKWLIEYRQSDFQGEPGIESRSDYALKLGPVLRTTNFKLETNYRRIGTDYRFVNEATQGERDQEGFFLMVEYRPWKELYFFGNTDYFNDNVSKRSDRNIIDTRRGLIGLSFLAPKYPSLYLTFDVSSQNTRFDLPLPVKNFTNTAFSEIRYQYKNSNPYLRYRWVNYKDEVNLLNEYVQNVATLGFRQNVLHNSFIYIEGETDRREYSKNKTDSRLSGKIGFNYYISQNLSCWGEATYYNQKDREEDSGKDRFEGAFGLNAQLPLNMQLYGDVRYDEIVNPQRENLKSRGLQASLRITKRFDWGKRERIAGLRSGIETRGFGVVEGFVFNDINRNGIQDKGEEGIKDVTIRLEDGSVVKTDERGFYQFPRVEVGGHQVNLDVRKIPADYSIISQEKVNIEVKLRETAKLNFQLIASGRIEGRVIDDANADGKADPVEKGLPEVLVYLDAGANNTYTDDEGRFVFENIIPGDYVVKIDPVTLPEDTIFTSPPEIKTRVGVAGNLKDVNFLVHVKPRMIIFGPPQK